MTTPSATPTPSLPRTSAFAPGHRPGPATQPTVAAQRQPAQPTTGPARDRPPGERGPVHGVRRPGPVPGRPRGGAQARRAPALHRGRAAHRPRQGARERPRRGGHCAGPLGRTRRHGPPGNSRCPGKRSRRCPDPALAGQHGQGRRRTRHSRGLRCLGGLPRLWSCWPPAAGLVTGTATQTAGRSRSRRRLQACWCAGRWLGQPPSRGRGVGWGQESHDGPAVPELLTHHQLPTEGYLRSAVSPWLSRVRCARRVAHHLPSGCAAVSAHPRRVVRSGTRASARRRGCRPCQRGFRGPPRAGTAWGRRPGGRRPVRGCAGPVRRPGLSCPVPYWVGLFAGAGVRWSECRALCARVRTGPRAGGRQVSRGYPGFSVASWCSLRWRREPARTGWQAPSGGPAPDPRARVGGSGSETAWPTEAGATRGRSGTEQGRSAPWATGRAGSTLAETRDPPPLQGSAEDDAADCRVVRAGAPTGVRGRGPCRLDQHHRRLPTAVYRAGPAGSVPVEEDRVGLHRHFHPALHLACLQVGTPSQEREGRGTRMPTGPRHPLQPRSRPSHP
jgi:hypothetical protein